MSTSYCCNDPRSCTGWRRSWLGGRRPGVDVPAVYVEHNAPQGRIAEMVHPTARRAGRDGRPRDAVQRAVLGLRRAPHPCHRARGRRSWRSLHGRTGQARRRRQRTGSARPGHGDGPAPPLRRRRPGRPVRHRRRSARRDREPAASGAARGDGPTSCLRAPGPVDVARALAARGDAPRDARRGVGDDRGTRAPSQPAPASSRRRSTCSSMPPGGSSPTPRRPASWARRRAPRRSPATGSLGSSRLGRTAGGGDLMSPRVRRRTVALVSEHASPLAVLGGVDAGGQNVHVAALAEHIARRGWRVDVFTRRDDPDLPRRVPLCPGVTVVHVDAGPPMPVPKDELLPHMPAFADGAASRLVGSPPGHRPRPLLDVRSRCTRRRAGTSGCPWCRRSTPSASSSAGSRVPRDTSPPGRLATEARLVRTVDHVIATCTDEVFELVRLGGDRSRMSVVPCGVDAAAFAPDGVGRTSPAGSAPRRGQPVGRTQGHRQRHHCARRDPRHRAGGRRRARTRTGRRRSRGPAPAPARRGARRGRPRRAARSAPTARAAAVAALGRRRRVRAVVRAVRHRAARGDGLRPSGGRQRGRRV